MPIDKSLYAAPQGMPVDAELPDVEVILPEMIENDDGSVEITLIGGTDTEAPPPFDANLVEYMDETDVDILATEMLDLVNSDIDSRSEWVDTYVEGLNILGLNYEEKIEPWEGACGVSSTILAEAVIRFQAETMSEVFPAAGPVRTKILG
ncbi:unnamed protein product, partial [marine sediment metagenome]